MRQYTKQSSLALAAARRVTATETVFASGFGSGSRRMASASASPSSLTSTSSSLLRGCPAPTLSGATATATRARTFSSSARARTKAPKSVADPERDTGLFYHPTTINVSDGQSEKPVKAWALSFLSEPSGAQAHVAFLLPPKGSSDAHDANPAELARSDPDRIRINAEVWSRVHEVLQHEVVPHDDLLQFEAETRTSGWAHLTDRRHALMPGRIATPENIIASVAFVDGVLIPESYERNASYRLVTGYEGPIQMPGTWLEKIRARLGSKQ